VLDDLDVEQATALDVKPPQALRNVAKKKPP
jgi:hypothetical protein